MKETILVFMVLNAMAFASEAVSPRPVAQTMIACRAVGQGPDRGFSARIIENVRTGALKISVTRVTIAGARTTEEAAQLLSNGRSRPVGAPMEWISENYKLSVNFTTRPNRDGSRNGSVMIRKSKTTVAMTCLR